MDANAMTESAAAWPVYEGRLLIDGAHCEAESGAVLERKSPAHDVVVGRYAKAGVPEAQRAVAAARRAFDHGPWPRMKGSDRARLLRSVADAILRRKNELALLETLENGK